MGSSRFGLNVADKESKCIPHKFPRSHWLKATGQCVIERYNGWSETPIQVARGAAQTLEGHEYVNER